MEFIEIDEWTISEVPVGETVYYTRDGRKIPFYDMALVSETIYIGVKNDNGKYKIDAYLYDEEVAEPVSSAMAVTQKTCFIGRLYAPSDAVELEIGKSLSYAGLDLNIKADKSVLIRKENLVGSDVEWDWHAGASGAKIRITNSGNTLIYGSVKLTSNPPNGLALSYEILDWSLYKTVSFSGEIINLIAGEIEVSDYFGVQGLDAGDSFEISGITYTVSPDGYRITTSHDRGH